VITADIKKRNSDFDANLKQTIPIIQREFLPNWS